MERINTRQRAHMTQAQFDKFRTEMRRLRKANHLSAKAFGELVDCSQVHIGNIERGSSYPSDGLAKDIAAVFDLTVEDMCKTQDERKLDEFANVGKELFEKRIARGFKICEVAGFLGIPKDVYMSIENGTSSITESCAEALERLYAVVERVETVEVVKEVKAESPISIWEIDKVLAHITDMDIDVNEQKALFRKLNDARTKLLEAELFG